MRAFILLLAISFVRCATASTPAGECFMLQALDEARPYVSNREECAIATAPASTFKIPHALIALETGVVSDPHAMVGYDGSDLPFDTWKRAHSLDSAMKWSVFPFFRRTATAIGRERMRAQLARLRYAKDDTFDGELTNFWNNGELLVTPAEQLDFLRRMFRNELPASRASVDIVRASLLMPEGSITNASGKHPFVLKNPGVVHAKTGNTRVNGERVSWLVGHIERGGRKFVFVARKRAAGELPGTAGLELARRMLDSARDGAGAQRR